MSAQNVTTVVLKMLLLTLFQTIGATDFEFFTIDGHYFMVVANAFDFTDTSQSYVTKSTVYSLNLFYKKFEIYQEIITNRYVCMAGKFRFSVFSFGFQSC